MLKWATARKEEGVEPGKMSNKTISSVSIVHIEKFSCRLRNFTSYTASNTV